MLNVWVDGSVIGGSWGSKKEVTRPIANYVGWFVRRPDGAYVHHHSFYMGENPAFSGNTAEAFAVNSALRWLLQNGYGDQALAIHSDSQLTVNQLEGKWQVNNEALARYVKINQALMARFPSVRMKWIRREFNTVADRLSKALQPKFEGRPLTREEVEALF